MSEVATKVIKAAKAYAGRNANIEVTAELVSDLGFDSLDYIEFVMDIENEFEISISDEEFESWKTLEDVIKTVQAAIAPAVA